MEWHIHIGLALKVCFLFILFLDSLIIRANVVEEITKLKQQPGRDMISMAVPR
jgi:hypothetical protein